jgi:hypothetical protein
MPSSSLCIFRHFPFLRAVARYPLKCSVLRSPRHARMNKKILCQDLCQGEASIKRICKNDIICHLWGRRRSTLLPHRKALQKAQTLLLPLRPRRSKTCKRTLIHRPTNLIPCIGEDMVNRSFNVERDSTRGVRLATDVLSPLVSSLEPNHALINREMLVGFPEPEHISNTSFFLSTISPSISRVEHLLQNSNVAVYDLSDNIELFQS